LATLNCFTSVNLHSKGLMGWKKNYIIYFFSDIEQK
jgi:hypothetical protein